MITVTTSTGFTCEVNEHAFTDFRVMSAFARMIDKNKRDEDKLAGATDLVTILLREQAYDLYDHLEDEGHYVAPQKVFAALNEIMDQMREASEATKKS